MKEKRNIIKSLALALTVTIATGLLSPGIASGKTDLLKRQQELLQEIKKNQSLLTQKKQEERKTTLDLKYLSDNIAKTENELNKIENNLNSTEKDINFLNTELKKSQQAVEKRTEYLSDRLKDMYEQGEASYLEVLLSATTITDFLTRWDLLSKIAENDVITIEQLSQEMKVISEKQQVLSQKQDSLTTLQQNREVKSKDLKIASSRKQDTLKDIQADKAEYEKMLNELEDESERIADDIRKLQGSDNTAYQGNGKFTWPTPGYTRITSNYGWRIHPILRTKRLHTGVDIGAPKGAKVQVAEKGKVIFVGWKGAYGNAVIVSHGGNITTMYPHLTSYSVSVGQEVKKGQVIAQVGSTGWATGPHMHFEVRVNGNPVNPMPYLK